MSDKESISFHIARLLSWIFHPLFMPILGLFILFNSGTYISYSVAPVVKNITYLIVLINTILLPGLVAILLQRYGRIESIHMRTGPERRFPFLITGILYYLTFYLLKEINLPSVIYLMILGASLTVAMALLIGFKWKISIHMIGVAGIAGAIAGISHRFMVDLSLLLSVLFLVCGIVGFARLRLNEHTPGEVYSGFFLGFFTEYLILIFI